MTNGAFSAQAHLGVEELSSCSVETVVCFVCELSCHIPSLFDLQIPPRGSGGTTGFAGL